MRIVKTRLGFMMFLQYAVWGFWLPILARYLQAPVADGGLGFTPGQVGIILGFAAASGAITAPFVAGQIADRYFSTERFLACLLIVGGVIQWILAAQTTFTAWLLLSILYSICYQPTIALTNSLSFSHLKDASQEFPFVRVWGTFGWIAASWIFPMVWLQTNLTGTWLPPFFTGTEHADATARLVDAMRWSGTVSFAYAIYCLTLPHTPPKKDAVEALAFKKAFALMGNRSFAVLMIAALPISIIHNIYFMQTAPFFSAVLGVEDRYIGPYMTIGQFAEIFVMAGLGLMLTRLGFRATMCIGGAAYFLRYAIFGSAASLPNELVIASQALHGFCFACFFATAFIYVDRIAPVDVRHSAQTVFGIMILGLGPILSAPLLGQLAGVFTPEGGTLNYAGLWYSLAAIAFVTTLALAVFFRDETSGPVEVEVFEEETLPA
jgi:nucleoside transporter